ncbi:hypothetical protein K8352_12840 [Flavobacteriaceae bacterium F89]|uniref:Right handed beta helix domain-containing protein n=1 Tax=Cerina litoralis TaxID=2874477 RepID=A0AAE3JP11_9FLAO|nr:hypothetical protein [Cerina litoralis]MCG2461640.1 hypothetical protein [Cerina litoralis]
MFFLELSSCNLHSDGTTPRNYYVSPNGKDSNTGSADSPWKTINHSQDKLSPGDTLFARGGTYVETVYIDNNGTEDQPIVISAYRGETPIVDGQDFLPNEDWGAMFTLAGSYIHVMGFEVKNSNITGKVKGGEGVRFKDGVYNKISFMKIHGCGDHGIDVNADFSIVEDCEVYLNAMNNVSHSISNGWANGISFAREATDGITDHGIIRRCVVYNNHGEGIDAFEANDITIEDCITYDNWTMNLYISDATNCLVQRNIVYNSPESTFPLRNDNRSGITLADEVSDGESIPHSANNLIINNFLYNADLSAFGWTLVPNTGLKNVLIANNTIVNGNLSIGVFEDSIVHRNSQIRNNIIVGEARVSNAQGIIFSNNNWKENPTDNVKGMGDIIGDPELSLSGDTAPGTMTGDYFKLLNSSPCIQKGVDLMEVTEDFFGNLRGSPPDMGGHEL